MIVQAAYIPPLQYSIKNWPRSDQPRERLRTLGARSLAPRELLALLIETGQPPRGGRPANSALDVASEMLARLAPEGGPDALRKVMTASFSELCGVPGIGEAKAAKVQAALELGRRAAESVRPERERLHTPRDVYERLHLSMRDLPREECRALLLNTQHEVLREVLVSAGTVDGSLVHARDVFRPALAESAHSVLLAHNHPSGEPTPSAEDVAITTRLAQAGALVGIPVLDHIIIGEGRYASFVELGLLPLRSP